MRLIKHALFILFFLILFIEIIQNNIPFINVGRVEGNVDKVNKPKFTASNWLNGEFQDSLVKYNEQNLDVHPFLLQCHNQVAYSVFGEINVKDIVAGKDNMLFEGKYLNAYWGQDFAGDTVVKEKVRKLIYIKSELKKLNIDFILLIVPGKASYFPEYLPAKPDNVIKKRTNYEAYTEELHRQHFEYLDLKPYFLKLKSTTPYPFFNRIGTHWTLYSSTLAADSLFNYMQHVRHINMNKFIVSKGEVTTKAKYPDNDIGQPMNLLCPIPSFTMYYPVVTFPKDTAKTKPDVLIIGDSFLWNWSVYYPFFQNLFGGKSAFWYYNKEVWWPSVEGQERQLTSQLNFNDQTMNRDFIILESSEQNLCNFGYDFIEPMYNLLMKKNNRIN